MLRSRLAKFVWVLVALVAGLLNFTFLQQQQRTVDVVVLARDVQPGQPLQAADLQFRTIHPNDFLAGMYHREDAGVDFGKILVTDPGSPDHSVANTLLLQGEPLMSQKLTTRVSGMADPTQRTLVWALAEFSPLRGRARPHDKVDVVITVKKGGTSDNEYFTKTINQLEIATISTTEVTFIVDPSTAELMVFALSAGTVTFTLAPVDAQSVETTGVTYCTFLQRSHVSSTACSPLGGDTPTPAGSPPAGSPTPAPTRPPTAPTTPPVATPGATPSTTPGAVPSATPRPAATPTR